MGDFIIELYLFLTSLSVCPLVTPATYKLKGGHNMLLNSFRFKTRQVFFCIATLIFDFFSTLFNIFFKKQCCRHLYNSYLGQAGIRFIKNKLS